MTNKYVIRIGMIKLGKKQTNPNWLASVLVNTVDGDDMSGGSEDGAVAGVVEDIPRHGALIPLLSKSGLSSEKNRPSGSDPISSFCGLKIRLSLKNDK